VNRVHQPDPAAIDPAIAARLKGLSALAAVTVAALGLLVLAGWWLDIGALKGILPNWATMKPNTALGFLLCGLALWALGEPGRPPALRRLGLALAALAALLGLLTLSQDLVGWDLGIDWPLLPERGREPELIYPGRMSPATAFCFLFAGLALLALDLGTGRRGAPAQLLILPALAVAFVAVAGYFYEVEALYRVAPFVSMALHTAAGHLVLGVGLLCARPERGWMALVAGDTPGGGLVRRLLPAVLLVPPALVWLGTVGQRAGLYDMGFGIDLIALACVLVLTFIVWWSARSLDRVETLRQRAESAVRSSEGRLRLALDSAYLISFEWDIQRNEVRRLLSTDPALGPTPQDAPGTFEQVVAAVHPEDRERFLARVQAAMEREDGRYESEFRIVRPGGEIAWLAERGLVERDPAGRPARLIGLSQDITARKQAEIGLRESESTLRSFYESSPLLMGVVELPDDDSDILHVYDSPATERFFGTPPGATVGRGARDLGAPPEALANWLLHYRASEREGRPQRFDYVHETPMGPLWLSCVVACIGPAAAGRTRFSYIAEDATLRREAEGRLAEGEERLRIFIEHAPAALAMFDREMRYVAASRRWLVDYGLGERDLTGLSHYEVFPEIPERWRAIHRRGLAGEVVHSEEDPFVRADGRCQWLRWEVRPWHDSAGEVAGLLVFTEDITERKAAVEALREADRRKDEFLATLAHELRNPLAPVRNAVEILKRQGLDDPAAQGARAMIERQVDHMVRLIDDLLDVSRITRGKLVLKRERVELAEVVAQALDASRPHVESGRHRLEVALPEDPIGLDADPVRLAQVFANLLNNAAKYTEAGGQIRLCAAIEGKEVAVRVTDTGIGIPPEHLAGLFEMFSQVGSAQERAQGGLGIGLALSRRLVELHGGRIEARSDGPGRGTELIVHLPVLSQGQAESPALPESPAASGTRPGRRILVVDDNRDSALSLAMLLELHGNEVATAHDGLEAVELAERWRPEVILLDLGMPKLDGYGACRRIRERPWGRGLPIVALTGWGKEDDRSRTREAGFDAHLVKPVSADLLFKVLDGH
jgi:PAS domain S-box-containing protein